jgi:hypothetical protein
MTGIVFGSSSVARGAGADLSKSEADLLDSEAVRNNFCMLHRHAISGDVCCTARMWRVLPLLVDVLLDGAG